MAFWSNEFHIYPNLLYLTTSHYGQWLPMLKNKHHDILKVYPSPDSLVGFTTAGDWDCVAAVERLPALNYSVDFIFLSFGIMGFTVEL